MDTYLNKKMCNTFYGKYLLLVKRLEEKKPFFTSSPTLQEQEKEVPGRLRPRKSVCLLQQHWYPPLLAPSLNDWYKGQMETRSRSSRSPWRGRARASSTDMAQDPQQGADVITITQLGEAWEGLEESGHEVIAQWCRRESGHLMGEGLKQRHRG